ncbi:cyclodeaminase/cyclohydrolase family protein [Dysosmobacter sp. NSJ-60]|uniref:Sugar ABC transporter substrate-binding protein n=1 Tax=Pusillibacter faecalis TaxID=2714358 RepID=A0A810Q7U1_9FIRM|nr:cyclodeaminase/cyclohydrolase family protein [Pusillibacter faecalis]MBC5747029.1 cyclodeaminase/cyclohydrolase family protein [Dysosmobacter hominis]BCK82705.1 sugar ABC transporter substrate-binding protein [Pusillibacter faecalis]
MSEKMIEKSCADFAAVLASKAPVPGGGGAAALVGALGTALCSMVGNLTVGRKKYAQYEADVKRMLEKGAAVQERLLDLVDKDAEAFEPLSKAYSIPKDDPKHDETLEAATKFACEAPVEMMKACCEAIELLEEMLEKGSVTLVSDVGCGALCCAAALESASMNIFVNTKTLLDREAAAKLDDQADAMLREYMPRARKVADEVNRRLRG